VIPDARCHDAVLARHAGHLAEPDDRIGHEVDDELCQGSVERAISERESLSRSKLHVHPGLPLPGSRDEGLRRIDGGHGIRSKAPDQLGGECAGTAADVEDALTNGDQREIGQLGRERRRIPAHESVVGIRPDSEAHERNVYGRNRTVILVLDGPAFVAHRLWRPASARPARCAFESIRHRRLLCGPDWAGRLSRASKEDGMDKHELLELYEIRGEEEDFLAAKPLYEQALSEAPSAKLLLEYGYLLECHARRELRQAVVQYRRAIDLDPTMDKARYQLIRALAALFDTDEMTALYEQRVADAPGDVREYRFLATAYVAAGRYERARATIDTGLELDPGDRMLIATRGDVKAGVGDPEGAIADWRAALELDDGDIGPLYSIAFLLEREGRPGDALEVWRSIVEWNEERNEGLAAEYPRSELERVRRRIGCP